MVSFSCVSVDSFSKGGLSKTDLLEATVGNLRSRLVNELTAYNDQVSNGELRYRVNVDVIEFMRQPWESAGPAFAGRKHTVTTDFTAWSAWFFESLTLHIWGAASGSLGCLLYTSDAADE